LALIQPLLSNQKLYSLHTKCSALHISQHNLSTLSRFFNVLFYTFFCIRFKSNNLLTVSLVFANVCSNAFLFYRSICINFLSHYKIPKLCIWKRHAAFIPNGLIYKYGWPRAHWIRVKIYITAEYRYYVAK